MRRTILTLLFLLATPALAQDGYLLWLSPAQAQDVGYFVRPDCGTLTGATNATFCLQSTTVSGRSAGVAYIWNGSNWIPSTSESSGGGHVIEEEGTPVTQRPNMNFAGDGVSVADSGGKTVVTVPAGSVDVAATYVWTGAHTWRDTNFSILDDGDITKILKFNISGITTGTTRTLTVPNASTRLWGDSDFSTTGIMARTGSGTGAGRTMTGTASKITVTNGDGVSGNPTFTLGADAVQITQTNVFGAFLQDFGAATLEVPNSSGFTPATVAGRFGLDSATGLSKIYNGSTIKTFAYTDSNITGSAASLTANPTDCQNDGTILKFAHQIDASGNLTCQTLITVRAADPTANDDTGDGYINGTLWLNTVTPAVFVATDVTAASAIWVNVTTAVEADTLETAAGRGSIIPSAVSLATAVRIGGPTDTTQWCLYNDPTSGRIIKGCTAGNTRQRIETNFTGGFFDEEGDADILVIDPDAASPNAMYQFAAAYKPVFSQEVRGTERGAVTIGLESIVTNQPKDYWATVTDANTDALDFRLSLLKRWVGITTATVRLVGVSKNAAPAGNIVLTCAIKAIRPGTDTYAAHSTTGEVTVTLTPATQNRPVAATSGPITLNGTVAEGGELEGSCEVDATGTTSAQMTDFRLKANVLVQALANSISD